MNVALVTITIGGHHIPIWLLAPPLPATIKIYVEKTRKRRRQ